MFACEMGPSNGFMAMARSSSNINSAKSCSGIDTTAATTWNFRVKSKSGAAPDATDECKNVDGDTVRQTEEESRSGRFLVLAPEADVCESKAENISFRRYPDCSGVSIATSERI